MGGRRDQPTILNTFTIAEYFECSCKYPLVAIVKYWANFFISSRMYVCPRVNGEYHGSLMTLATILTDTGRGQEGLRLMERAVGVAPSDTLVRNNMAALLLRQGTMWKKTLLPGRRAKLHKTQSNFLKKSCHGWELFWTHDTLSRQSVLIFALATEPLNLLSNLSYNHFQDFSKPPFYFLKLHWV